MFVRLSMDNKKHSVMCVFQVCCKWITLRAAISERACGQGEGG